MDTKHGPGERSDDDLIDDGIEESLDRLEKADPADAPRIADEIASGLAAAIEQDDAAHEAADEAGDKA